MPASRPTLGITLQQFAYFLSAVEHGSLSAAAEANYIAQPSLSEQIRRMERTLGVPLFVRTNRTLILTDAALTLIPYAEEVLAAARTAVSAVTPIRELTGGTVSFGTFSTARYLLHRAVAGRFREKYPEVGLRLIADNSVHIADEVREGRLEAGIVALPVDDSGLETEPVAWSPQMYFCSATPPETLPGAPKTVRDIVNATLVMPEVQWGDADPTRRRLMEIAQKQGMTIRPVIEVSPVTALELAADGVADTISPYPLVQVTGLADRLHVTPLDPPMRENFAVIRRRNAALSPGAAAVRRIILDRLAEIPADSATA